ncbi:MAG TPA: creatininase family protein [Burkholderiales bacterium]|jgi:creatinine amidohydrolase|nr:creatininase family protein [Burkholderiales bacterium]
MKSQLEDLTYVEFRERLKDDPVILVPLGSQEEQGASAPMGDWMLAKELARRIAEKTGAIAAPTVPFGYADYFRPVAGGVQLSADTFKGLLRDILDNFLAHGLERLLIFNGHTGNSPLIDQVVRTVKRETGVVVPWINIWRVLPDSVWREAHGANAPRARGHGADPVSSAYLHLFPGLYRRDLAEAAEAGGELIGLRTANLQGLVFEGLEVNAPVDITDHTKNGIVSGDARLATPEAGRLFSDYIVDRAAALVRHLQTVRPITPSRLEGEVPPH